MAQAFATSFAVEHPAFERAFVELLSDPKAFIAVAEVEGKVACYILGFEHLTFFVNGRAGANVERSFGHTGYPSLDAKKPGITDAGLLEILSFAYLAAIVRLLWPRPRPRLKGARWTIAV